MENESFTIMANQPFWVTWILIYGTTLLGSLVMYLFSFSKGFNGAVDVLQRLFPERQKVFYDRMDFVLTVFLGAAVGAVLFSPSNPVQAVTAGLGWVSAVNILMTNKESS
ncbi:hypothetical protein ACMXYN_08420 [Neptuniibacter sp. PT8_73]|uniref:hypothetical protein n=1 Tax=Neptuniibacter sp. PT8_73 TaxID=3398206 RepID=UPI0039F49AA5